MSIYSNVTEQDLNNLRNIAEQQKNQRALKIKNRFRKQTHDKKLAESLSPITKKLDEVEETTHKLGDVIEENKTLQLTIEKTHKVLPIENEKIHPGVIYDTSLENTLKLMKINTVFFNLEERDNGDIIWNGFRVEKMGDNKLKNIEKIYNVTPGIQKVLTNTSNIPLKKLNDKDREVFNKILKSLDFEKYKAIRGESKSGRYKQSKTIFKKRNLEGQKMKIFTPSNIIDIYTRLEVLLGFKLTGDTDTLTEASKLIDEIYRIGEIQNEQQNRNALDKFSSHQMELPSKLLERIAFNTRPKIEVHMLIVMD